jgi:hypothetical protein
MFFAPEAQRKLAGGETTGIVNTTKSRPGRGAGQQRGNGDNPYPASLPGREIFSDREPVVMLRSTTG